MRKIVELLNELMTACVADKNDIDRCIYEISAELGLDLKVNHDGAVPKIIRSRINRKGTDIIAEINEKLTEAACIVEDAYMKADDIMSNKEHTDACKNITGKHIDLSRVDDIKKELDNLCSVVSNWGDATGAECKLPDDYYYDWNDF